MIVYLIPLVITLFSVVRFDFSSRNGDGKPVWIFLYIYVVLLMGLRFRVGLDTLNYMDFYDSLPSLSALWRGNSWPEYVQYTGYQPFYLLLCATARSINTDFAVLQLLHAIILNAIVFTFIKRKARYKFFALLFYFFVYFLYFNTEIIRESLAIGIFLINLDNLLKRKWIRYYVLSVLSILFHISAVILLIFPLLRSIKFNFKFLILLGICISAFIIAKNKIANGTFVLYFDVLNRKVDAYEADNGTHNFNYTIYQLVYILLIPMLAFMYDRYYLRKLPQFEFIICMTILLGSGAMIYPLVFSRFNNYLLPITILYIADTFAAIYQQKTINSRLTFYSLCLFCIICYGYRYENTYKQWIPYTHILNPKVIPEREVIRDIRFNR